jgi:hypothetical protein
VNYFFTVADRRRINYFRDDIMSRCMKRLQAKNIQCSKQAAKTALRRDRLAYFYTSLFGVTR